MPPFPRASTHGACVRRIGFRGRLFLILLSFALVPSIVLTVACAATSWEALPGAALKRRAREFGVLRSRMIAMAAELARGRRAALEAGRVAALRGAARQGAHEPKNPLTPIKFGVDRLRREAPPSLRETVD